MPARVIHQDTAHHLRRQAEEVSAVLPRHGILTNQPQIRFVHEGRRLQRMVPTLLSQVFGGLLSQSPIDQGQ
jgi:hypothetical protein